MKTGSLTICALFFFNVLMIAGPQAMVKPSTDGREAAEQWLRLVDAGRYAASWNRAARSFRSRIDRDEWIASMKKVRIFYGKALSRKFENAAFDVNPPGFPSGEFETIWYKTHMGIAGTAMEVISLEREHGGEWRVRAFYIAPERKLRFLPLQFFHHGRGKLLSGIFPT